MGADCPASAVVVVAAGQAVLCGGSLRGGAAGYQEQRGQ